MRHRKTIAGWDQGGWATRQAGQTPKQNQGASQETRSVGQHILDTTHTHRCVAHPSGTRPRNAWNAALWLAQRGPHSVARHFVGALLPAKRCRLRSKRGASAFAGSVAHGSLPQQPAGAAPAALSECPLCTEAWKCAVHGTGPSGGTLAGGSLGALAPGVSPEAHARMEHLLRSGGIPRTTLEQRLRNRLAKGTKYGVPPAVKYTLGRDISSAPHRRIPRPRAIAGARRCGGAPVKSSRGAAGGAMRRP